ncbi:sigma-70 domain-containing protein, partial [Pseudoalteromonas ruthenica]
DRPVEDVSKMLRLNEKITSVDTPIGGDNDKALLDIIADERGYEPESEVQNKDINRHIVDWLGELNPK